jgi:cell division protein FtsN
MAKFGLGRRSSEDEELPEEEPTLENVQAIDDEGGGRGRGEGNGKLRRILIILGIGVVLVGGAYLANTLFLQAPERPPAPPRPAVPVPPPAPAPPPVAAPAPAPPTKPPVGAPAPAPVPAPPAPSKAEPPAKTDTALAPPAKAPAVPGPAKAEPAPPARTQKAGAAEAKPAAKDAAKATFSLQVGAMVVRENAEGLKRKLDQNGFPVSIREGKANVSRNIVTVGEPGTRAEAEEMARRLNVDGFPSQIVAVGGKYTPQVGTFFSQDEAIDLARELQKKNHVPKITARPTNTVVYQVRHGRFSSRSAAVRRGEELKAKGYTSTFMVVRD